MPNQLPLTRTNIRDELNRLGRAQNRAKLGDLIYDLIDANNGLRASVAALQTKLNADAGVTDTNYGVAVPLPAVVKKPEDR